MENRITTAKKVEFALKEQGRKKIWLAEKLEISRPTLDAKLKDNTFTTNEIIILNTILEL